MVCYMAQCKCGTHVGVEEKKDMETSFQRASKFTICKAFRRSKRSSRFSIQLRVATTVAKMAAAPAKVTNTHGM